VRTTIGESAKAADSKASGNGHRKNGLRGKRGGGGGGDDGEPQGDSGDHRGGDKPRFSPVTYKVGMAAALAAVSMTFGALTIVYLFRAGGANWQPLVVPRLLWISTTLLVLSSFTFEAARLALRRRVSQSFRRWMSTTIALGAAFIVLQLAAWRELSNQGFYLAGNPHSSFFYLLTGAHAVHLLGGIAGTSYLLFRLRNLDKAIDETAIARRETLMSVGGLYWHSMDVLWLYIFALLFLWG